MFMTPDLLEWATQWQPVEDGPSDPTTDHNDPPLALRRHSTAAPLPLEGILKLQRDNASPAAGALVGAAVAGGVRFKSPTRMSVPPATGTVPATLCSIMGTSNTSPGRADEVSSQSQSMTAPTSPSVNTLRQVQSAQSLLVLTRRTSELGSLSRTSSLSAASMKTRALAAAAAAVIRHIVEVGACGDPQCLMFYDVDVFINPLSLNSRQKIASFRKHPGSSNPHNSAHQPAFGTVVADPCSPTAMRQPPQLPVGTLDDIPLVDVQCDETFEPEDLDFDLMRVSRRLFSSVAQQSLPLSEYLVDALNTLSSSSSPLLCTPETFVFALILLERMQHASLLARAGGGSTSSQQTTTLYAAGRDGGPVVGLRGPHLTSSPQTPFAPSTLGAPVTGDGLHADDRVRSFLDETTQVRLTKESLQSLSAGGSGLPPPACGGMRCSTPSAAVGQVSDTESNPNITGGGFGKMSHATLLCVECVEQPGLALHASNVQLFFAAAVCVAIKMREDFANGPEVLLHVAALLHCPNVRTLCLAERCLCDMLKFDVHISVHEYRLMLRQLASHRQATSGSNGGAQQASPTHAGGGGRGTPVTPVHNSEDILLPSSSATSPPSSNNFMTLFATV